MLAEGLIKMQEEKIAAVKGDVSELEAKLAELEAARDATKTPEGPRTFPMDEEDQLRLENILLHEKVVARERADARDAFHSRLVAKYKVNILTETVSVDANTGRITVAPKQ